MEIIKKTLDAILTTFGLFCLGGVLGAAIGLIGLGSEALGMPSWAWGIWAGSTAIMFGCSALTSRWSLMLSSIAGMGIFVVFGLASGSERSVPADEFAKFVHELARTAAWGGLTAIPGMGALLALATLGGHCAGSRKVLARNAGDSRW